MDHQLRDNHGHPVATGIIAAVSVVTIRYYAREHLIRTHGTVQAMDFFHRADSRLKWAIGLFGLFVGCGIWVSYASLNTAYLFVLAGVAIAAILILPPGIRMCAYASSEIQHRRATRGSIASRAYQTGQDKLPRIFQ